MSGLVFKVSKTSSIFCSVVAGQWRCGVWWESLILSQVHANRTDLDPLSWSTFFRCQIQTCHICPTLIFVKKLTRRVCTFGGFGDDKSMAKKYLYLCYFRASKFWTSYPIDQAWKKPPSGIIKVNVYASFHVEEGRGVTGRCAGQVWYSAMFNNSRNRFLPCFIDKATTTSIQQVQVQQRK